MKIEELKPGLKNRIVKIVSKEDTARFLGSGDVEVLATPVMILWMEDCARQLADGYLGEGRITVGVHVDVYHKAPAPIGAKVVVEAELKEVKGRKLLFQVKAYLDNIVIGEGIHERYIVDLEKFRNKVNEIVLKISKG